MKRTIIVILAFALLLTLVSCTNNSTLNDNNEKTYSYDELLSEFERILDQTGILYREYENSGNQELLDVFKYIGGEVADNYINIRIIDIDDKKIDIFRKYISDFDNINFMNSEEGFVEQ